MVDALFGLPAFSPEGAALAALVSFRVGGVLWTAPLFSARFVPARFKAGLTLLLVVTVFPVADTPLGGATVDAVTILSELAIGMTLGLGAGIFVAAAEAAGDMLAVQMGLSGANVLDPLSQTQLPVLGQFLGLFVTAMILALGGHVFILRALAASTELLPVGGGIELTAGAAVVIRLGGKMLALGLQVAAPVVAAMMIGNVALGILARTVPQLNVLMVAFPVQIAIGLFVLGATLPLMASLFSSWGESYFGLAEGLLLDLRPAPGGP
jgi:flagellar biosynthetic protein FliR